MRARVRGLAHASPHSQRVADDLEQYRQWRSHLHDLGECEVKHDVRLHVVNLYTEELGNPDPPKKLSHRPAAATQPIVSVKPETAPSASGTDFCVRFVIRKWGFAIVSHL
jgi:hypothetical protein